MYVLLAQMLLFFTYLLILSFSSLVSFWHVSHLLQSRDSKKDPLLVVLEIYTVLSDFQTKLFHRHYLILLVPLGSRYNFIR